jgi:hypothetical protein
MGYLYSNEDLSGRDEPRAMEKLTPADALEQLFTKALKTPGAMAPSWSQGWKPAKKSKAGTGEQHLHGPASYSSWHAALARAEMVIAGQHGITGFVIGEQMLPPEYQHLTAEVIAAVDQGLVDERAARREKAEAYRRRDAEDDENLDLLAFEAEHTAESA